VFYGDGIGNAIPNRFVLLPELVKGIDGWFGLEQIEHGPMV
jgi:hypothetical protein